MTYEDAALESVGVSSFSHMRLWRLFAGFCEEVAVNRLLAFLRNRLSNVGQISHLLDLKADRYFGEPQHHPEARARVGREHRRPIVEAGAGKVAGNDVQAEKASPGLVVYAMLPDSIQPPTKLAGQILHVKSHSVGISTSQEIRDSS
jgi:hypothetical protein